jgi:hypothetical protein
MESWSAEGFFFLVFFIDLIHKENMEKLTSFKKRLKQHNKNLLEKEGNKSVFESKNNKRNYTDFKVSKRMG